MAKLLGALVLTLLVTGCLTNSVAMRVMGEVKEVLYFLLSR